MNKVILIGNLTKDVDYHVFDEDSGVSTLNIAVSRDYTNKDGERETDFFTAKVFGKKAELVKNYLSKGKKVGLVGSLQNRSYEDKDGVKRTITEVIVSDVEFLTPKGEDKDKEAVESSRSKNENQREPLEELNDNQLPF